MSLVRFPVRRPVGLPVRSVLGGVFAFSPDQVSGTQAFYDPSDLTSLYQSRTGGSIVSADGQTVGIMLDKSQMGGKTAAAFIAGAEASGTEVGDTFGVGGATPTSVGGVWSLAKEASGTWTQSVLITLTGWYAVTFTVTELSTPGAGAVYVRDGFSNDSGVGANGTYTRVSNLLSGFRVFPAVGGTSCKIQINSCKALPGHHALAPSDAARPLYKTAGGLHWLQPDGTDDFKQVSPTLDLGETWWHVGGWKATSGRAFTTTSWYQNAIRATGSRWIWYNDAGAQTSVSTSDPVSANVTTIEKASNASLSLRFNGVGEVSAINPFDETGVAGLALFTQGNGSYAGGLNGRFYGGTFGTGTLSPSDRAKLEAYTAAKTGVTL